MRKSRAPLSQLSCMLISALLLLYPKHRVYAYLCDSLPQENWESLVDVIQASFGGFVMLCPFEISGEGCPPEQDFPGYVVDKQENFYLMCEALYSSGSPNALHPSETGCIIDCPGTSFELRENASLTIDSFTIRGSQQTAIRIGGFASLNLFNSFMER